MVSRMICCFRNTKSVSVEGWQFEEQDTNSAYVQLLYAGRALVTQPRDLSH